MWTSYKNSGIKTADGQITLAGQPGAVVGFYAYSGGRNAWEEVAGTLGAETRIWSLAVYGGKLYGGTHPNGKLYRWNDVNAWEEVAGKLGAETQIRSLAVYGGKLYGGTGANGKLYRWNDVNAWEEVAGTLGAETHINSLAVYGERLYGGTGENGKLYRWNGVGVLTVELKDGSSGTTLVKETIPAAVASPVFRPFPFPGVMFSTDIYLDVTSIGNTEVIVFYYD